MSHISEQSDNHKTESEFIPSSRWGEDVLVEPDSVRANLFEIENKIAPLKPRIIGVTKYFGLSAMISGYKAGLRDFAESRALEAVKKINALPAEIQSNAVFHFIGHLQTNKVEKVVEAFDYIHSVDSLKLASVISKSACRLNKREKIFLQVNNSGEVQKFGYDKVQLKLDLKQILELDGIELVGLMNMAPFGASQDELRELFGDLRRFRDELETEFEIKLPELSMGMSNDYLIAVEEGATMIRIGRKLFN